MLHGRRLRRQGPAREARLKDIKRRSQSIGGLRVGPDTDTPVHKRWYLWTAVSIVGSFLIVACFFVWRGFRNYKRYKRALEEDERLEWEAKAAGRAGNGGGGQATTGQGVMTYYAEAAAEPAAPAGPARSPTPADELGGYQFMQQYAGHHTFAALHANRLHSSSQAGAAVGHASATHQHIAVASASATVAAAKPLHGLPARPASAAAVMSAPASPLAGGAGAEAARATTSSSMASMPLSAAAGSSRGVPIEQRVGDLDARYQSLVARVGASPLYKGTASWGQSGSSPQSAVPQPAAPGLHPGMSGSSGRLTVPRPTPLSAGMTSWQSLPAEAKRGAAGTAQQGDSGTPVVIEMAPTTAARAVPDVSAGPAQLPTAQQGKLGGMAVAANGTGSNGYGPEAGVQRKAVQGLARSRSFSSVEQLQGGWQQGGPSTAELLKRLGLRRLPRPLGNTADAQGWTTRPRQVAVV
ncbi:hypothetical protein N2152v2_000085 [Parachlorella kessleri]